MVCATCNKQRTCFNVCEEIEQLLPNEDNARLNHGHRSVSDLRRLYREMHAVHIILEYRGILSGRQAQVVDLYYNDFLKQTEIAGRLNITQESVHKYLTRAYKKIYKKALC
ncbi:MAG: sigma factor-like helix-turn-helix DNA-binding protein [Planctomycetota bacterium]